MDEQPRSRNGETSRSATVALAVMLVLAFAMRLACLRGWALSPWYGHPLNDELYIHNWALAVLRGEYTPRPFFRAPLYPLFVTAIYAIWGAGPLMVRVLQMFLGLGGVVLSYAVARSIVPWKWALAAAALVAANPLLIYFDAELVPVALQVALDLGFLLAVLKAWRAQSWRWWALAGLCAGIAALARPNILLPAGMLMLYALWRGARSGTGRTALLHAACFFGFLFIPILPVAAFNAILGQDRVLICSQAGINFYLGNAAFADGFLPRTPVTYARPDEYRDSVEDYSQRALQALTGRAMKPSAVSRFWTHRALGDIASDPGRWARLMIRKTVGFLSVAEIRNNKSPVFVIETAAPWLGAWRRIHNMAWLAPMALAGAVVLWRRNERARLLAIYAIGYAASVIAFFVCSRFRAPLIPVFAVLAMGGAHGAWRAWRERGLFRLGLWAVILLAAAIITNVDWFDLSPAPRRYDLWALHTIFMQEGDVAAAEQALEEALEEQRAYPDALYSLGRLRLAQGHMEEALGLFEEAVRADARHLSSWNALGSIYRMRGDLDAAREAIGRVLALDERHVNAWLNLAALERQAGNLDAARRAYQTVVDLGIDTYRQQALEALRDLERRE